MTRYEEINVWIQVISTIFLLVGAVLAIIQLNKINAQIKISKTSLESTYRQLADTHDWNRRINALEAMDVAKDPSRSRDLELLEENLNYFDRSDPITIEEIEKIENEKQFGLKEIIRRRLNVYELLCVGIHQGVYDEEVIKDACQESTIRAYTKFLNYIEQRRKYNPEAYLRLEEYTIKWKAEKNPNNPRETTGGKPDS